MIGSARFWRPASALHAMTEESNVAHSPEVPVEEVCGGVALTGIDRE
jgi:hypothetical protein